MKGESQTTAGRRPWKLIYYEAYLEERDAVGREVFLKSGGGRIFLEKQLKAHFGRFPQKKGPLIEGVSTWPKISFTWPKILITWPKDSTTWPKALRGFKQVLRVEDPVFGVKLRKTEQRVPVVLSKGETERLFQQLDERYRLAAKLQYGAGLRLSELVRLRIQDLDLERGTVTIRAGKGDKDRVTVLPSSLQKELRVQVEEARKLWQKDRDEGKPGVYLPGGLGRKFARASESFEWFYLFPAMRLSKDPETGLVRRHHLHGTVYRVKGYRPTR